MGTLSDIGDDDLDEGVRVLDSFMHTLTWGLKVNFDYNGYYDYILYVATYSPRRVDR